MLINCTEGFFSPLPPQCIYQMFLRLVDFVIVPFHTLIQIIADYGLEGQTQSYPHCFRKNSVLSCSYHTGTANSLEVPGQ